MKIEEFVSYYKMAKNKKAECEKRIQNKYVPFLEKITECDRIAKATTLIKKNPEDPGIYHQSTPARFLFFNLTMIARYTDIELTDAPYEDYDKLNECGALDDLISAMPVHEFKEFNTLLSMTVDDFMANERDLTAYLDRKLVDMIQILEAVNKGVTPNE